MVRLSVAGGLEVTDHEAHAVARLLEASGTEAGRSLAGRLDPRSSDGAVELDDVELDDEEKRTLLAAFGALRRESLPENLAALERALDGELARVARAPGEAYPHDR
jgi:hypothetical protein